MYGAPFRRRCRLASPSTSLRRSQWWSTFLRQALIQPLAFGAYLGDFQESYMRAARRLAVNSDPYDLCRTMGCLEPTGPQYVMPPPLAWLLQPLISVDSHAITVGAVLVLNA